MTDEIQRTWKERVDELVRNVDDPIFNTWEKAFIRDLMAKKNPQDLNALQRAVVNRLFGWLKGK